jgi:alpha-beta hydrolase superfamily lysophospholipase
MTADWLAPDAHPAHDYADAAARIAALQARDTDEVDPCSRTQFLTHGVQAERAIVFFHGYTNSPAQWRSLAPLLFERGYNVFVPRAPQHGFLDRLTPATARLRASDLVCFAGEAVDIARGLGRHVTVTGLSMGGVLAGWAGQTRDDVDLATLIAPAFGLRPLPRLLTRPLVALARRGPNLFMWWDPRLRADAPGPLCAYPRYATRGLAEIMGLALAVHALARRRPPAAHALLVVTNPCDEACDNRQAVQVAADWRAHGGNVDTYAFPAEWKLIHDLIDPDQPQQQTARVYPVLADLMTR